MVIKRGIIKGIIMFIPKPKPDRSSIYGVALVQKNCSLRFRGDKDKNISKKDFSSLHNIYYRK